MTASVDNDAFFRFALDRGLLSEDDVQRCRQVCEQTGRKAVDVVREFDLLTASYTQLAAQTLAETVAFPDAPTKVEPPGGHPPASAPDTPLAEVRDVALAGHRLGRYQLVALLGEGGMGVAYRAWDTALEREVALKMMRQQSEVSYESQVRFLREARAVAGMGRHPNIVSVYELGDQEGISYFTMELVVGQSMTEWISRKRPSLREILEVGLGISRGMAYAHDHGIIHRDLKPDNVLINGEDGRPLVMDFGVAREVEADHHLTATGAVIGTPGYLAPEQAGGHLKITAASDIYSLGVVLYEALAGELPFQAESAIELLVAAINQPPEPLQKRAPEVPSEIEAIVMCCLAKQPDERPPSMKELGDQLQAWLNGQPLTAPWLAAPGENSARETTSPPRKNPSSRRLPASKRPVSSRRQRAAQSPPRRKSQMPLKLFGAVAVLAMVAVVMVQRDRDHSPQTSQKSPGQVTASQSVSIEILAPSDGQLINEPVVYLRGKLTAGHADYVRVGEQSLEVIDGQFQARVALPSSGDTTNYPDGSYRLSCTVSPDGRPLAEQTVILDRTAPELVISSPKNGDVVDVGFTVTGSARDLHLKRLVTGDGTELDLDADGGFSWQPPLPAEDGALEIKLTGEDRAGNEASIDLTVLVQRVDPEIRVTEPKNGAVIPQLRMILRGWLKAGHPDSLRIQGHELKTELLEVTPAGQFTAGVAFPGEGRHELEVGVRDAAGRLSTPIKLEVMVDLTRPSLSLNEGSAVRVKMQTGNVALITSQSSLRLRGWVQDATPATVTLDGVLLELNAQNRFSVTLTPKDKPSNHKFVCRDMAGHETVIDFVLARDITPPQIELTPQLPKGVWSAQPSISVRGYLTEAYCQVLVNDEPAEVTEQRFHAKVALKRGSNSIEITAKDIAGHTTSLHGEVHYTKESSKLFPAGTWWQPNKAQVEFAKKKKLPLWFENELGMRMVLIPPGKFLMGSPPNEAGRAADRETQHPVHINRGFYIQATETTNGQVRRHLPTHDSGSWYGKYSLNGNEQPAVKLSWHQAIQFCQALDTEEVKLRQRSSGLRTTATTMTGTYQLPTEAQWEYACRAGTRTATYWGDNNAKRGHLFANLLDPESKELWLENAPTTKARNNVKGLTPMLGDDLFRASAQGGSFSANPWGLFDMIGNANEWCRDEYMGNYASLPAINPIGKTPNGAYRSYRPSSFRSARRNCRSACRSQKKPGDVWTSSGFRVVLELPE